MQFTTRYSPKLRGEIKVPGDKSISHRAIMLGSISQGITNISGFLAGDDALATLNAFREMGVKITRNNDKVQINGVGLRGLKAPKKALNLGNSGTSVRLISGILVGQNFNCELIGDASLSKRPMDRIIFPLKKMEANITSNDGKLPLKIKGSAKLKAINYKMPMASAQVKSCILLAGLYAKGTTCVNEPAITRDHSEKMLKSFGVKITKKDYNICLTSNPLTANDITIPSDISSAAFFMVAASIAKDADITLKQININPTRTGVINILQLMGANISLNNKQKIGGELLADIRIKSANLNAINVPSNLIPLAIDEFPVIFIAMACAQGTSTLTGAKELRLKESDRITTMAAGLEILGIKTQILVDGIKIIGSNFKQPNNPIQSYSDHRIAMAFAIASCACKFIIKIEKVDNVKTSFPNFIQLANKIGIKITDN